MAHLYQELTPQTQYVDKKSGMSKSKWLESIKVSRTLYIGNLSFYTSEEQLHELFSKCGDVKRVVMGLNRYKKSPCGFCFVEYHTHEQAAQAVNLLNKTSFDDRLIRVDWDAGISEGRQYGRGESGNQWRDDFRADYDVARGGQGGNLLKKVEDEPDKQVYVGKMRNDHGRFVPKGSKSKAEGGQGDEPPAKRKRTQDGPSTGAIFTPGPAFEGFGAGLPMTFGPQAAFRFVPPVSDNKGKGKGKGRGKGKHRGGGGDR